MAHSNHIILKKKHHFSSLQLSDPELDELEKYPSDEEPEDIPFDEVIHEDSPRRENMPVETPHLPRTSVAPATPLCDGAYSDYAQFPDES